MKDGKIIIVPLNNEEEEDLPIDTPVMVMDAFNSWVLRYYAGKGKCFSDGYKSKSQGMSIEFSKIIPFDKFNPNNIEESLKYNIVK